MTRGSTIGTFFTLLVLAFLCVLIGVFSYSFGVANSSQTCGFVNDVQGIFLPEEKTPSPIMSIMEEPFEDVNKQILQAAFDNPSLTFVGEFWKAEFDGRTYRRLFRTGDEPEDPIVWGVEEVFRGDLQGLWISATVDSEAVFGIWIPKDVVWGKKDGLKIVYGSDLISAIQEAGIIYKINPGLAKEYFDIDDIPSNIDLDLPGKAHRWSRIPDWAYDLLGKWTED